MGSVILALDIATVSGFAHDSDAPGMPIFGHFRAPGSRAGVDGGFDFGGCFAGFHAFLRAKIAAVTPSIIVYEAPLNMVGRGKVAAQGLTNQNTLRLLFGYAAYAEGAAKEAGIPCYEKNIATVKKYLTQDGHATKEQMMRRCRMLGWQVSTDDEADACGLWALSKATLDPKWGPSSTPLFGRKAAQQ